MSKKCPINICPIMNRYVATSIVMHDYGRNRE